MARSTGALIDFVGDMLPIIEREVDPAFLDYSLEPIPSEGTKCKTTDRPEPLVPCSQSQDRTFLTGGGETHQARGRDRDRDQWIAVIAALAN
ncbi:MAG: hypothetical protein VR78_11915 [Hoeflea sp. BRH_c9]|nr:MAG: hypothetical protein VR78_11915 [Hoeflea sp. BRH_c9]